MKPFIKAALTVALVTVTVLATAHLTYRETMRRITPTVSGNTVTLTVWGQADEYEIDPETVN